MFFFYTHFLYVIYYCSKFQLFKICQLVYSPLFFFLNSATFYVKKWNYRITVICLFLLAVNKLSSVQFSSIISDIRFVLSVAFLLSMHIYLSVCLSIYLYIY